MLGHLAAVLGQDVAQAQHVAVRRLVEDQRPDRHQRVEPAAGLVDRLADEVGRVGLLEALAGTLGVREPPLGERHGAAVEPGVDDLGHPPRLGAAGRAGEGHLVDVRTVRVQLGLVGAGELGELGERAHAHLVVVGAAPDGQRGAPVAAARERPVDVVVQPVPVAAPLDRLGEPAGVLVLADQVVLDRGGPDVPRRLGVVHQRRVAAPAVRVAVLVGQVAEQQPPGLEVLDQVEVGVLEELAADQPEVVGEVPVGQHRVHHRQAVGLAHRHVVLAERGGLVHQAGAVLGGDVPAEDDVVRRGGEVHEVERALVGPALHVAAGDLVLDAPALTEHLLEQRRRHDQPLPAVGGEHVGDVGVRGHGGVGDQRPRRGRPHQQAGARAAVGAAVGSGGQREPDVDRRVGDGLVALGQLVVGEPGAAARAVRRDAVVLDQQAAGVDVLQRPPHRLHVAGVHGAVGVLGVDPVPHPLGHLLEGVDVPQHRRAALGVELRDAVRLDVILAGEAELLLDRELHGEAVAVPARLALDVVAAHRLEAGEDVLEDPGLDVVGAGHPVRGGRALVERPARTVGGEVERLLERPVASQRPSTPCSSAGRSTCGGTGRYSLTSSSFVRRRRVAEPRGPAKGREPAPRRPLPRYHPP